MFQCEWCTHSMHHLMKLMDHTFGACDIHRLQMTLWSTTPLPCWYISVNWSVIIIVRNVVGSAFYKVLHEAILFVTVIILHFKYEVWRQHMCIYLCVCVCVCVVFFFKYTFICQNAPLLWTNTTCIVVNFTYYFLSILYTF